MILQVELPPLPDNCSYAESQTDVVVRHLVDAIISAWATTNPSELTARHLAETIVASKLLNLSLVTS